MAIWRAFVICCAVVLCTVGASQAQAKNVALLIGNSEYESASDLANPANDVKLVAGALKSIGFTPVIVDTDLSREVMNEALRNFSAMAQGADVAVVYFAGHGLEISGVNYLLPVSAPRSGIEGIRLSGVRLDDVMAAASGADLRIVILDACRNNPYRRHLAGPDERAIESSGLGDVQTEGETLVVYATKAGSVAEDGSGRNSPFALSFAQRVVEPGVEVRYMLANVRDDVLRATEAYQEPYIYGSLSSKERYLAGSQSLPRRMTVALNEGSADKVYWEGAKVIGTRRALESYLFLFPDGAYRSSAEGMIANLPREGDPAAQSEFLQFCQMSTEYRFPFDPSAQADVALPDALALFSSADAKFALSDARESLVLEEFERFLRLRQFFDQGVRLEIALVDLPAGYDEVEFAASGTSYRWRRGETDTVPFFWTPFAAPKASVRLYSNGSPVKEITKEGPWAFFRIFNAALLRRFAENEIQTEYFGRGGAIFSVVFPEELNPFGRAGVWNLACVSSYDENYPPDEFGDRG